MTYEEAKTLKASAEASLKELSDKLNAFPKLENGLTPDAVKASPAYRAALGNYRMGESALRKFNQFFVRRFKKEYAADRRDRNINRMLGNGF